MFIVFAYMHVGLHQFVCLSLMTSVCSFIAYNIGLFVYRS